MISIVLEAIGIILLVAVLFVSAKKRNSSDGMKQADMENLLMKQFSAEREASAAQYDRLQNMMLSRLDEVKRASDDLSTKVNDRLIALKDGNAESMKLFFNEQEKQTNVIENALLEIRKHVSEEFGRIRTENRLEREAADKSLKELSAQVRSDMDLIRLENDRKLEQMRVTVDEKLEKTLDSRLSKSFEQVSRNLDNLYRAIGEINKLSKDVGDLNKLFGNVKSRGVWGEVQIDSILSDILAPEQFERNFRPRKSSLEVVEFAIKLPGRENGNVYIPVDSKFPKEDYERYVESLATGDMVQREASFKALRDRVKKEAADVSRKYINPPVTTDFAILFVPTESLYAELLRIPGYVDEIQNAYKVIISGPTTFSALVTSLQMGFRTLQIEKKSKQVWVLFAQIKKQMDTFTKALDDTQVAIDRASDRISDVIKRHHRLNSKLGKVELPDDSEAAFMLESKQETDEEEN